MKRIFTLVVLFAVLAGCQQHKVETEEGGTEAKQTNGPKREVKPVFQTILDGAGVEGTILIFDTKANTFYSNDFDWAAVGRLPASTFKITNSIIALETGVVEDDSTLFEWDGQPRRLKQWEQDLVFRDAFHKSCVPCYQEIAREIGAERMNAHLKKFDYGEMIVDTSTIDLFWLEGESKISPFQQIDFLQRFYSGQLPISKRTESIMKRLMVIEESDDYTVSGKTGWAIRNGQNNGWFVGYVETAENVLFFAVNVNPGTSFNMDMFPSIRVRVTQEAFRYLGVLE